MHGTHGWREKSVRPSKKERPSMVNCLFIVLIWIVVATLVTAACLATELLKPSCVFVVFFLGIVSLVTIGWLATAEKY